VFFANSLIYNYIFFKNQFTSELFDSPIIRGTFYI